MQNFKSNQPTVFPRHSSRRNFLKTMGAIGSASLLGSASALSAPAKFAHRLQFQAEAYVYDLSQLLVWPIPNLPELNGVPGIRLAFPYQGRDILQWITFVNTNEGEKVITLFFLRVNDVLVTVGKNPETSEPEPNFALFGEVILNETGDFGIFSPFGDLTGRVGTVYAAYNHEGDDTTFRYLGGAAAGSHATAVVAAGGFLHIQRPL